MIFATMVLISTPIAAGFRIPSSTVALGKAHQHTHAETKERDYGILGNLIAGAVNKVFGGQSKVTSVTDTVAATAMVQLPPEQDAPKVKTPKACVSPLKGV